MRIIQIINHAGLDRGGAERLARGLHEDLLAMGQDARLIALEACDLEGLEGAQSLGFGSPRDPRAAVAVGRTLQSVLRAGDIVHTHLFPSTLHVSALNRLGLIRTACTMTEHSTWNRRRDGAVLRSLDRNIYRGFDRVIAISKATEAQLLETYPLLRDKTSVIENGVALSFSAQPMRCSNPGMLRILSVGRLVRAKNIDGVLKALTHLKHREWRYDIVGDGPERSALEAQARAAGLSDRVHFAGQQTDVTGWLAQADIFVMPSRHEGFGLAAVEAMNAGLPVVASDVPGLREVVAPTGADLVLPEDPRALSDAILRLLGDPEARARLGAMGQAEARRYGRDRMARDYLAMWQDLAKQGGAH